MTHHPPVNPATFRAVRGEREVAAEFVGWMPLLILPILASVLRESVAPWMFMWILAVAIFAGFKWWTYWRTITRGVATTRIRSIVFLFLWPGMDADKFLALDQTVAPPRFNDWLFAAGKTLFGAILLWGVARLAGNGWGAGWIGMIGFIFILHFGIFHSLALFWRRNGIDAQPLMRWPILATSPSDFWSKRWNAGFRDLAFGLLFLRLTRVLPPRVAMMTIFLFSGFIHELVITFPARAGYGLPTLYFVGQGLGLLTERSRLGTLLGLRRGITGRTFALALVVLPIFALFPAPFVVRVMVPFFQFIHALS